MSWRDLRCGELRPEHVGQRLTLAGWVAHAPRPRRPRLRRPARRDRRRPARRQPGARARGGRGRARDPQRVRPPGRGRDRRAARPRHVNPNLPTGEVELQVDELEIVSRCPPLPFQLDEEDVDETLRIRYRWLDLRREQLQRNIRLRAQIVSIIRAEMEAAGFVDIETPILAKPTPEGARDFLVPTRLQQGRFFALPQSPQISKQLLVIAGFERYYQIARCFRDEDLRADRLQELTQLDVEMAFPDREFIFALMEQIVRRDLARDASGSSSRRRSRA